MTRTELPHDDMLPQHLARILATPRETSHTALRRLEPEFSYGRHLDPPPINARPAAVAIVLYLCKREWHIPFVVRPIQMRNHAGQVAFPGGQVDAGESTAEAALRELEEELGIARSEPALLGPLSPLNLFVTNFVVHPWIAVLPGPPEFVPCPDEVAEVVEIPLEHLMDGANVETLRQSRNGIDVTAPCIRWQAHAIWGATAILLGEFLDVLELLQESRR